MTDHDPTDEAPEMPPLHTPAPDADAPSGTGRPRVLGIIPAGAADTQLGGTAAPEAQSEPAHRVPARSHRRAEAEEERPLLPRGGMVLLRRSGGFVFRTSEIVVYRDGRVTYDADGAGMAREKAVWVLSDQELRELRQQLDAIDFAAHRFAHSSQSPDSYSYELVARVGRRIQRLELGEAGMPPDIEPLVRTIAQFAPPST